LRVKKDISKSLSLIDNHLEELRNKIKHYFPLPVNTNVWLSEEALLSIIWSAWELCELQSDRTLNMRFADLSLGMWGTQ
jgi:hypothetical protein